MTRRRSVGAGVLDWWQAVLDETKEFIDDGTDRLGAGRDRRWDAEVAELRELVAELTATVDGLGPAGGSSVQPRCR